MTATIGAVALISSVGRDPFMSITPRQLLLGFVVAGFHALAWWDMYFGWILMGCLAISAMFPMAPMFSTMFEDYDKGQVVASAVLAIWLLTLMSVHRGEMEAEVYQMDMTSVLSGIVVASGCLTWATAKRVRDLPMTGERYTRVCLLCQVSQRTGRWT